MSTHGSLPTRVAEEYRAGRERVIGSRSVLVVEDDPAIREMVTIAVGEELGVAVAVARDGAEALARAHELAPAVVLLDLMLPETDGFEVARQLRADPATADAWIIALSAAGPAMESAAHNAGCDEFLPKPFELAMLLARVEAGLERAEADDGPDGLLRFPGSA